MKSSPSLYQWIQEESYMYNQNQSERLAKQFLAHLKQYWNLTEDAIDRIQTRASLRSSEVCNFVYTKGYKKGTKCRFAIEPSDEPTQHPCTRCKYHQDA